MIVKLITFFIPSSCFTTQFFNLFSLISKKPDKNYIALSLLYRFRNRFLTFRRGMILQNKNIRSKTKPEVVNKNLSVLSKIRFLRNVENED